MEILQEPGTPGGPVTDIEVLAKGLGVGGKENLVREEGRILELEERAGGITEESLTCGVWGEEGGCGGGRLRIFGHGRGS